MQSPLDLTAPSEALSPLPLPGGGLQFAASFCPPAEADALFLDLRREIAWQQDVLTIAGRRIPVPRLQAWYGVKGADYGYSGLALHPLPWLPALEKLRQQISTATGHPFNAVLANLYRDGRDSVDWHADNEAELGESPVIASLSLGATRRFQLKPRPGRPGQLTRIELTHGSLLVMEAGTQAHFLHRIPKEPAVDAPRINLTFRHVATANAAQAD